jgi:hypothetical protein
MANKLFESLNNNAPAASPQNLNTPSFWGQVEQMQRTVQNPQAVVEQLLSSGQMSRQEFEQMGRLASQMLGVRPK